jgi:hypothetical protein
MGKKRSSVASEASPRHFRDRVVRLDRIRAGDLIQNEKNWRTHPEAQQAALKGVLSEIGWTDALIARERSDGKLELVDGHLRQSIDPEEVVPVLVVDVTEEESDKLLTVLDPMSAMAGIDTEKLEALLSTVEFETGDMDDLLEELRSKSIEAGLFENGSAEEDNSNGEAGNEDDPDGSVGGGFVNLSFPVTTMQEIEIRKYLKQAKERWGVESSGTALFMALEDWATENVG